MANKYGTKEEVKADQKKRVPHSIKKNGHAHDQWRERKDKMAKKLQRWVWDIQPIVNPEHIVEVEGLGHWEAYA